MFIIVWEVTHHPQPSHWPLGSTLSNCYILKTHLFSLACILSWARHLDSKFYYVIFSSYVCYLLFIIWSDIIKNWLDLILTILKSKVASVAKYQAYCNERHVKKYLTWDSFVITEKVLTQWNVKGWCQNKVIWGFLCTLEF